MRRSDANRKLWFFITDPETVYEIWFEQYERGDPIRERRDQIVSQFMLMLRELTSKMDEAAALHTKVRQALAATGEDALDSEERESLTKLSADLRDFRSGISSPDELCEQSPTWTNYFGKEAALVAAQIFYAFHAEKRPLKQSDGIDFVHAIYLPHVDLWRGDKAFSDLLIKHKVKFWERIVPTLADLPGRIETEIRKGTQS